MFIIIYSILLHFLIFVILYILARTASSILAVLGKDKGGISSKSRLAAVAAASTRSWVTSARGTWHSINTPFTERSLLTLPKNSSGRPSLYSTSPAKIESNCEEVCVVLR